MWYRLTIQTNTLREMSTIVSKTSNNFGSVYMGNDKACVVIGMRHVQIAMDNGGVGTLCDV